MITYPVSEEQVHFLCPSTERTAMHCPRMNNPWKLRILLVLLALIFCLPLMAQNTVYPQPVPGLLNTD